MLWRLTWLLENIKTYYLKKKSRHYLYKIDISRGIHCIVFKEYTMTQTSVQFSSVTQSCLTLCDPMDCSTPGLPVHHQLLELAQTHVHRISDAIQIPHPLSTPPPPAFNPSQCQGFYQWVGSSYQVAKILEFQLQHQSFQWIFRTNIL